MAVTYEKVPREIPSPERSSLITFTASGDRVDLTEVLGRSARGFKIIPDDATDSLTYRLNNRIVVEKVGEYRGTVKISAAETFELWQSGFGVPEYTETGATVYESVDGLPISSIEFVTIVYGAGGASISMVVW
jgi:hypothetical protein